MKTINVRRKNTSLADSTKASSERKAPYSLRKGGDREEITIIRRTDRFTIIIKESDLPTKEGILTTIHEIIGDSGQFLRIREDLYEVIFKNIDSLKELNAIMLKLRTEIPSIIVHHIYYQKGGQTNFYLTDEIIVTFSPDIGMEQRTSIESKFFLENIKDYKEYKYIPGNTFLLRVTSKSGGNPIKIANSLREVSGIVDADPNLISKGFRRVISPEPPEEPDDEAIGKQWHLNSFNDADNDIREDAGINASGAWQLLKEKKGLDGGDPNIVIAIIDFSFRVTHDALENRLIDEFKEFDFVTRNTENAFQEPMGHHGTRCAGVALANEPNSGVNGVAYGCKFLPVKIPQNRDDSLLIEITEKIAEKADIISCSLSPDPAEVAVLHPLLFAALKNISERGGTRRKGCVICFAAGNFDLPINANIRNPLDWCAEGEKQDPYVGEIFNPYAAHPNIIAVSASTSNCEKAPYSSYGREISVCAPSDNYPECKQRRVINRVGPGIWTTDLRQSYTDRFGGTSSAAILVAGVAALVLSANPDLDATRVRQILEETADQINFDPMEQENSPGKYKRKVQGNLTGRKHSIWFGYGKVNAFKAVEKAFSLLNQ